MTSMVNHRKKICFLHFSKTGGWWVNNLLKGAGFSAMDMKFCGGHHGVDSVPDGYESFGFIRHPINWYVSLFRFLISKGWCPGLPDQDNNCLFELASTDINGFVKNCIDNSVFVLDKTFSQFYGCGSEKECTNIFRYEDIHREMHLVSEQLDLGIDDLIDSTKTLMINFTKKRSGYGLYLPTVNEVSSSLSEDGLSMIKQASENTFKRFGYCREIDPEQGKGVVK